MESVWVKARWVCRVLPAADSCPMSAQAADTALHQRNLASQSACRMLGIDDEPHPGFLNGGIVATLRRALLFFFFGFLPIFLSGNGIGNPTGARVARFITTASRTQAIMASRSEAILTFESRFHFACRDSAGQCFNIVRAPPRPMRRRRGGGGLATATRHWLQRPKRGCTPNHGIRRLTIH
jgi:hypothetical protein